jgi:hypothetical protein
MNSPISPPPSPASTSSHLSIIILASLVALIGIIVITTNATLPPQEETQPLSMKSKTRIPDTLDEEIDQQIRTLNPGSTLTDIDKDIESTPINASDQEIQFLNREMQRL